MRIVQRWLLVTIVALLAITVQPFGALASPGSTSGPERSAETDSPTEHQEPGELIVRLKPGASDEGSQQSATRTLAGQVGDGFVSQRNLTAAGDVQVFSFKSAGDASSALETLQNDPSVAFVEPNYARELHWVPDDEEHFSEQESWVEAINLPEAWNITTGDTELVVAVIDSGVSPTHPDLAGKLVPGYNAVDGSDNWADIDGHGTHVAGIVAASGDNLVGTAGTAMDVKIMPIRVMADNGSISVSSIHDAIIWAVDNGADVLNLSLGSDQASETELSAVQYAYQNDVPLVASAGNRFNKISYPASYPEAISVGALNAAGDRAQFSSILSAVDIAAPGELIFSPHWDKQTGEDSWSDQLKGQPVSGTSFAAAIVSGTLALQKSVNPDLTVEEVRSMLKSTALDTGVPGLEAGVGAGQIDAEAVVRGTAFMAMYDTWYPTDFPVATGAVTRTWLWGTDPPAQYAYEEYDEAQHDVRLVYYYDKSRMEMTDPLHNRDEAWYISNGLLVNEMISGELQTGDASFETRQPAAINVAGDPDDTLGPTYASFTNLLDAEPLAEGEIVTQTLSRSGQVGSDEQFAVYDVYADHLEPTTNHRVADVFWAHLNSEGLVAQGDELITTQLFDPLFYATGLPVTEAYWSEVTVAEVVRDVLVQCFERRCMTYTPDNDPAWRVEMGNVGLHYYNWRYESGEPVPVTPLEPEPPVDEVLYESTLEDWPAATFTGGATFYEGGTYHIQVTDSDGFQVSQFTPDYDYADITSQIDVRLASDAVLSEACLIAHAQPGLVSGYLLCIDGSGETVAYQQGMNSQGNDIAVILLESELRDAANPADEWNTLTMSVGGPELVFSVNGVEVGTSPYSGPSSGAVGIVVTNDDEVEAEYEFRDLSVRSFVAEP